MCTYMYLVTVTVVTSEPHIGLQLYTMYVQYMYVCINHHILCVCIEVS